MHQQSLSPFPLTGSWWTRITCLGHPYGNTQILMKPKKNSVFGVGASSSHANLSLCVSNSRGGKWAKASQSCGNCSSELVPPFPVLRPAFPHYWSRLENESHHKTKTKPFQASVAQLVGALFYNWKVVGSIPGQGTCPGWGIGPQSLCGRSLVQCVQEAPDQLFSLTSMFLSFLSL